MFYRMIRTGISAQYCYPFTIVHILMSDNIIECSYELMEINFVDTKIPALCIDLNCLCVMAQQK